MGSTTASSGSASASAAEEPASIETDPVCGMPVRVVASTPAATRDGRLVHFCSQRCRMVDLGRWLDGRYAIPTEDPPEEDPPTGEGR